jgi:putative ABC transport system permease protein
MKTLLLTTLHDARFGLRLLKRSPAFGATLLAVLILGIGATTAMFSLVSSLLLRPLPYPHPEELTILWTTQLQADPSPASYPDFRDWRAQATTFSFMAAMEYDRANLSSASEKPDAVPSADVTGDFFHVLGASAARGRLLDLDDDRVDGPKVAVISSSLWRQRFASDPGIVGRTITLNAVQFTVVGVVQEGFRFAGPYSTGVDIWTPMAVSRRNYKEMAESRGSHSIHVIGRRRPGVSLQEAQAQMTSIAKSLEAQYPDENLHIGVRIVGLHDELVGTSRKGIWILFGAVALVFLVMCANVSNLLLARAASRRSEMAARAALGATRGRMIRQLITETLAAFFVAAVLGSVLAHWLVDLFAAGLVHSGGAFTINIKVDAVALGFAIGISLLCGLIFGLVPAREAARVDPHAVLKESGARDTGGRSQRFVRGALVIAQVALAFALLVGGGLALRAFMRTASTPIGFEATNVVVAKVDLPAAKYASDEKQAAFFQTTLDRIAAQPSVVSVSATSALPMDGSNWNGSFRIEGKPPWPVGSRPWLERNVVAPGYFKTMGMPLLRGRDFDATDVRGGRRVMIISQAMAERYFPGEDPIGKRVDWGIRTGEDEAKSEWREVIGIVGDVRKRGQSREIPDESYVPFQQLTVPWMTFVVKTAGRPQTDAVFQSIPETILSVDPEQALFSRKTLDEVVAASLGPERFTTILLGSFAAAALLLATLGIFGLVSYTTNQRTRELGIRLALGSSPERIIGVVMRDGMRLLAIGLGLGLLGAFFVGRMIANNVSGATSFDVMIVIVIAAILGIAGTIASLLPALRAIRISPAMALRYE